MKTEEQEAMCQRINQEGFDYAFMHYSDFREIQDKKFHELRKKFIKARTSLAKYLNCDD